MFPPSASTARPDPEIAIKDDSQGMTTLACLQQIEGSILGKPASGFRLVLAGRVEVIATMR